MVQAHQVMSSFSAHCFRGHPSVAPVVMLHIFTIRAMMFALDKAKVTITKRSKCFETMDKLEARLAKLEKEILTRPTHHCVQGQTFPSLSQHFNPFSIRDLQASYSDIYFCCKSVPAPVQTVAPLGYGSTKSVTTPSLHNTRVFALAVIGSPPLP
jgi:hypothetical protein